MAWDPAKFAEIVGRAPTPEETAFYSQAPDWEAQVTANTPEADRNRGAAATSTGGAPPSGGNIRDATYARQLIDYYAQQPGADPSLASNPDYWVQKMTSGEFGDAQDYAVHKMQTAWKDPPVGSGGGTGDWWSGQGVSPTELSSYGVPDNPYASSAYGSSYQQPAIPGNLASPYTLPTQAELEATPGYGARLAAGQRTLESSAAARGSILNGGTQKALARYGQDYASNEYSNFVGQSMGARSQNQNEYQQNVVAPAQVTYQNQYRQYLDDQNRELNDYLTNYNIKRTGVQDFLGQQNRTADRGLQATQYGRPA